MGLFMGFVFIAVALTLFSLASGILAMASDGEIAHYDSASWMSWRVGFQAIAFVLVLLALLSR